VNAPHLRLLARIDISHSDSSDMIVTTHVAARHRDHIDLEWIANRLAFMRAPSARPID
jgi:hypothetical protein